VNEINGELIRLHKGKLCGYVLVVVVCVCCGLVKLGKFEYVCDIFGWFHMEVGR
jgi:hypothetical protein